MTKEIRTDNTETLKNALERIAELEEANTTLSSMNESMWVEIEKKESGKPRYN